MKNLILSLLVFVSVSVNGQVDLISEPYMVHNVQGNYYDSNNVYQYVEQLPEYVGFKFWTSTYTNTGIPHYPTKFTMYGKEYSVGRIEILTSFTEKEYNSYTETITLELRDKNQVVGSMKIIQPYEDSNSDEVKFTLNVDIDGYPHKFVGNLDHSLNY